MSGGSREGGILFPLIVSVLKRAVGCIPVIVFSGEMYTAMLVLRRKLVNYAYLNCSELRVVYCAQTFLVK